jgi:hypothetical protein
VNCKCDKYNRIRQVVSPQLTIDGYSLTMFRQSLRLILCLVFIYVLYNSIQGLRSEEKTTSSYVDHSYGGFMLPSVTVCPSGEWPFGYQNLEQSFRINPWIHFLYGRELGVENM